MKIIYKIKQIIGMFVFRFFPIKRNRILFMSYYGKHINCNPYAIYCEVKKRNSNFECVWVDNNKKINEPSAKFRSIKFYYYLRTSKFIIFNGRPFIDIKKRKAQFYIQTWHSSLGFKMIEKDAEDSLNQKYVKRAKKDSTYIDLLISGCKFRTECFKRNFWYDGKIAEYGTPRNDILFSSEKEMIIANTKKELGINPQDKIILFTPTFRNDTQYKYTDSMKIAELLKLLQKKFSGSWRFVYRLHPNVITDNETQSDAISASKYSDMQSLLLSADILLTDYSSAMFDFMLQDKPIFLFCPDYDEYIKNERKSYFSINDLPFNTCKTYQELESSISAFNETEYMNELNKFKNEIGSFEKGNASRYVVDEIERVFNKKSNYNI